MPHFNDWVSFGIYCEFKTPLCAAFIKKAQKNGLTLSNPSSAGDEGDPDSHENYIIKCVRDEE